MRILFVLLFLLTTSVQSNTLPTKEGKIFWDENLQVSYEGEDFKVGINNSAGYLGFDGHNILSVLHDNKYLFTPDFPVGIIDAGFYKDHADFHGFMKEVLSTESDSHGTGVASVFSVSEVQNNLGTHGIVNAKSLILDYSKRARKNLSNYRVYSEDYKDVKIITQSITLEYCTSYRAQEAANNTGTNAAAIASKNHAINSCGLTEGGTYDETDMVNHVEALAPIRQHFKENPDTLFILSAGNESVDASWMNGAVHYEYIPAIDTKAESALFKALNNVLIVAAVGYDEILHNYSDYGESVDIAVISGVLAASCVDEKGSHYATDDTEDGYGIYRQNSDLGNTGAPCDSTGYGNGHNAFNGTSAAAPIAAGMSALLFSLDSTLPPMSAKAYLKHRTSRFAKNRYTGVEKNKCKEVGCHLEKLDKQLPIIDLRAAYDDLKYNIKVEVLDDIQLILNKTANITSTNDCSTFWQQNNAERDIIGPKKVYESLFYGNKCLYFRGNSFIIEYDIPSKLAKSLYYGDAYYDEYQTVRKFINNMESARTDETWRQGYGLTLNLQGNVGLTQNDLCPTGQDSCLAVNTFTNPQQCENIWKALTGTKPQIHDIVPLIFEEDSCFYLHVPDYNHLLSSGGSKLEILRDTSIHQRYLSYNSKINQEQIVANVRSNNHSMFDLILQFIRIKRDYNSYTGIIQLNKNHSLRLFAGLPICSPEFDSGCIDRTDFNKTESYAHCKSMVQLFSKENEELKYDYIKTPGWCKILHEKGKIITRKEIISYDSPLTSHIVFMMYSDKLKILDNSGYNQ